MSLTIAAIGKMKSSPEQQIMHEYLKRIPWNIEVIELEEKKQTQPLAKQESEGRLLLQSIPKSSIVIALDEHGKQPTSREFAMLLQNIMQQGKPIALLIGGADGHSVAVKQQAHHIVSFGKLTYPHLLIRALLMEQLYRAWTILNHHPYHRD